MNCAILALSVFAVLLALSIWRSFSAAIGRPLAGDEIAHGTATTVFVMEIGLLALTLRGLLEIFGR